MMFARPVSSLPQLCLVLGSLGLAACVGNSSGDAAPATDAGSQMDVTTTPDDGGTQMMDTGPNEMVTANAANGTIYLGQQAQLDASSSAAVPPGALTYAWTVVTVPVGSTIVTASLLGANSAKPTFTPDAPGAYALKVTVTAAGVSNDKPVTVTVVAAPIFYIATDNTSPTGQTSAFNVVRSDGTGTAAITCPFRDAGPADNLAVEMAAIGADWWEAPAGTDSRAAFFYSEKQADGGALFFLASATSASSCAAPPLRIDSLAAATPGFEPRFSPDGSRIAYVRTAPGEGARLATIAADGTNPHFEVAQSFANDGGVSGVPVRPRWQDATHLGWISPNAAGTGWQLSTTVDTNGGVVTAFMTCPTTIFGLPRQFDFLPDGSILVSATTVPGDGGARPQDLVVLKPNAGTQVCEVVRNLTNLPSPGSSTATDFSLSPDKKRVAFVHLDTSGTNTPSLFIAAVDGTTPAAAVSGAPTFGASTGTGPRWIAGGALLSWGQSGLSLGTDAGVGVAVISAGGGSLVQAVTPTTVTSGYSFGNGCSIGVAGGSAVTGVGSLLGLVALIARRRRAKR